MPSCGISTHASNTWMISTGMPSFSRPSTSTLSINIFSLLVLFLYDFFPPPMCSNANITHTHTHTERGGDLDLLIFIYRFARKREVVQWLAVGRLLQPYHGIAFQPLLLQEHFDAIHWNLHHGQPLLRRHTACIAYLHAKSEKHK